MPGLRYSHENLLYFLQMVAVAGLLARMAASQLVRTYRYFFFYLVILGVQLTTPFLFDARTNAYAYMYLATETAIICFYALIVLELYSLVLRDLRGIAKIAKRYVRIAVGIAAGVAALLFELEPAWNSQAPRKDYGLMEFYNLERMVVYSLVFFVVLITAFLVYYPVPLSRNIIYYSIGYAFYFTSKAIAIFLQSSGPDNSQIAARTAIGAATVCLLFWTCFLTKPGEVKTMVLGHKWNTEDEERLLRQLEAINTSLLRARK